MKKTLLSLLVALLFNQTLKAQGDPQQDTCLIAKYYFNYGNVNDDYIGGYNGTQVGATLTTDRFGNPNSAWYLNGTPNSYINLGTYSALKRTTMSISMWFKMSSLVYSGSGYSYNPLLLTKCRTGSMCHEAYCIYYNFTSGGLGTGCTQYPSCNQPSVWNTGPPLNSWHHVVITFDNDTIKLYKDAVLQGYSLKGFSQVFLPSDSIMVGNAMDGLNNRYFNGSVDDMRFYHCVLNQTQVTSLFNEPNPNPTTGINPNNVSMKTNIFPNPTSGEFTVTVNKLNENSAIEIYNTLGQLIKQEPMTALQTKINLNEQAKGVYLVRITESSKPVYFSKIVKQ